MPKLDSATNAAKFKFMAATKYLLRVCIAAWFIPAFTACMGAA